MSLKICVTFARCKCFSGDRYDGEKNVFLYLDFRGETETILKFRNSAIN